MTNIYQIQPLDENLARAYDAAKDAITKLNTVINIDKKTPLTIDQTVIKFGRSTGNTVGVVCGTKTDARISSSPVEYQSSDRVGDSSLSDVGIVPRLAHFSL